MSKEFDVMTYKDVVVFNYTLPEEEAAQQIDRELTLVWEDSLEKFFEAYNPQMPYQMSSFKNEREKNRFLDTMERENEKIIDDVEEEISRKMKFSFDYTSPTYED